MADKEFCGKPYRQLTLRLRISQGPGKPDRISERPHSKDAEGNPIYRDLETATLIAFGPGDLVDVGFLLQCGAIGEYAPPVEFIKKVAAKGKADGEESR